MKKVEAQQYIQTRLEAIQSQKTAKAEEVLIYLTSVLRGESLSEVVVVEGTGEGCSQARRLEKAPDEKERLKAAELLGKRFSLFSDRVKVEGGLPVVIVDDLEADDLEEGGADTAEADH